MTNNPTDLQAIQGIVFDVDGVLTDGRITYTDDGHELKSFHVQDGASIKLLMENEIAVAIITGRRSPIVARRARELGVSHLVQGAADKTDALDQLIADGTVSDFAELARAYGAHGATVKATEEFEPAFVEILEKTQKTNIPGLIHIVTDY